MRVRAHAPLAARRQRRELRHEARRSRRRAPPAGSCAATPRARAMCFGLSRTSASGTWCERHVPSTGFPSTSAGPVQPFGVRSTIIGHAARSVAVVAALSLDRAISSSASSSAAAKRRVHARRLVARDEQRPVAVALAAARRARPRGCARARSGSRSCSRSGAGSAARRRRAAGSGTCSSASSPRAGRSRPRRRRRRSRRAGRGCRTPRRRRATARSRARRPRGSSPGVSGATWLGIPPGNENWRKSRRSPASSWPTCG